MVVGPDHPLAGEGSVWLGDMKNEYFFTNNTAPDVRDSAYDLCHKAGFEPKVKFEGDSARLIGELVCKGLGVAFVTRDRKLWRSYHEDATDADRNLVYLDLKDDFCMRTIRIKRNRHRRMSTAALLFYSGLLNEFKASDSEFSPLPSKGLERFIHSIWLQNTDVLRLLNRE